MTDTAERNTGQGHTLGPWKAYDYDSFLDEIVIETPEGEYVASIDCDGAYEGKIAECINANARLIAAAPDMLEALRGLAGEMFNIADHAEDTKCHQVTFRISEIYRLVTPARAAIAKAEGKA